MRYLHEGRFLYSDAAGKPSLALLRKLPAEIAKAGLEPELCARLLARVDALQARAERPERDTALQVEMRAAAPPAPLQILMSGDIGEGFFSEGITAAGVTAAMNAAPGRPLHIQLNSRGGDAYEGAAIRGALKASGRDITVDVIGLAASAASVIMTAATPGKLRIAKNGVVMIHNASGRAYGGVQQMEAAAACLRAINDGAAEVYAERTGRTAAECAQLMAKETYMSAARAKELGFVDEIIDAVPGATAAITQQLSDDDEALRAALSQTTDHLVQSTTMDKEIRARLGLPETATEAEVFAALDAKLKAEKPAPAVVAPTQAAIDAAVATAVAAAVAPFSATQASEAHALACSSAVERFIAERKIPPAGRDKAIKACGPTAATLQAAVEYWTEAPSLLPEQRKLEHKDDKDPRSGFSPMLRKMQESAGVSTESLNAVIAEGH